jgi:hypothetical protein
LPALARFFKSLPGCELSRSKLAKRRPAFPALSVPALGTLQFDGGCEREEGRYMALIDKFENVFGTLRKGKEEQAELKEIFCNRKDDGYVKRLRTAAVGCEYSNVDGSARQDSLDKLKVNEKVRLIWGNHGNPNKNTVYLVRKGKHKELSMPDCFGRLNDRIAAEVIRRLTQENVVSTAKVVRITGGTRKNPRLGCVVELSMYPGPQKKKKKFSLF